LVRIRRPVRISSPPAVVRTRFAGLRRKPLAATVHEVQSRIQPIATAVASSDMATDFGLQSRLTSGVIIMNVTKSSLSFSLIAAGALLASLPVQAAPDCAFVSSVERRIVERANGDVASLRTFVGLTAFVYGVNMIDVRDNLDNWRKAVACHEQVAAAERAAKLAAAQPAAKADEQIVVSQR
jgi:hypothetical protein